MYFIYAGSQYFLLIIINNYYYNIRSKWVILRQKRYKIRTYCEQESHENQLENIVRYVGDYIYCKKKFIR